MKHHISSNSLKFERQTTQVAVESLNMKRIDELKGLSGSHIYLCGGGQFAGWLLENRKIDVLKIKLNPVLLGEGIRLFGTSNQGYSLKLTDAKQFEHGLQIITYDILYTADAD